MSEQIKNRVREIAADVFGVTSADLTDESTPATIETWDSLAQLNLMIGLEDEFGVVLEPDDIGEMASLGDVAALIAARAG